MISKHILTYSKSATIAEAAIAGEQAALLEHQAGSRGSPPVSGESGTQPCLRNIHAIPLMVWWRGFVRQTMKLDIVPHSKTPATLFAKDNNGEIFPVVNDLFQGCATLLQQMWPPEETCELWIECLGQTFSSEWINVNCRAFRKTEGQ
jgi:hypothetical protein